MEESRDLNIECKLLIKSGDEQCIKEQPQLHPSLWSRSGIYAKEKFSGRSPSVSGDRVVSSFQ